MKHWLQWALLLLSFGLFGVIIWYAGPEPWRQLLLANRSILLIAFCIHGSASMVAAARLRFLSHSVLGTQQPPWRRFYYLTMSARALGLILPRTVSAIGGKTVGLRAMGVPLKYAVWIIVMDNMFDVALLSFVAVPALLFMQGVVGVMLFLLLVPASIGLLAILSWWLLRNNRLERLLDWLRRYPWLARRLDFGENRPFPPAKDALIALGWSVLLNGIIATSFYSIGRSISAPVSLPLLLASYPLVQLSLIIAIAPGGLGIFDAGWLGLLRLGSVPEAAALAFVVAQRAFVFVFVLLWAGFSALLSLTVRTPPKMEKMEAGTQRLDQTGTE